ncbi:LysR family transcriptional regulator, partial [Methylobacterium sp. WL122]
PAPRPAELHLALRRDGDDPLIARLIAILAALPPG